MNPRTLLFLGLIAGAAAVAGAAELQTGTGGVRSPPPAPPVSTKVTVELTAATLGDDCYRATAPEQQKQGESVKDSGVAADSVARRCQPTSMQLSVVSPSGAAPSQLRVKKVELFEQKGKRIGELTPGAAMVWSARGLYVPWDQSVVSGQSLAVSYTLSEPNWSRVKDRMNKTYQLKVVVSVGGVDQTLQRDVTVIAEVSLPPNVVT